MGARDKDHLICWREGEREGERMRVGEGGWWKRVREDKNRGISER